MDTKTEFRQTAITVESLNERWHYIKYHGDIMKTQNEKVLGALQTGASFTVAGLAHRTRLTTDQVSKAIHNLKNSGYMVYSNRVKGSAKVEYRIGTPSRRVISAGIAALRAEGISV